MDRDQRPTVLSLFTGAGGLDIGLELAGFRTVAAVECDADCVETLRRNQRSCLPIPTIPERHFLADTQIVPKRIEEIEENELRPAGASPKWAPDLIVGGPPCQPFSSSGELRSVADPRGRLFEQFVRLTRALQPRFVLFENVRGLVTACGPKKEPGEAILMVKDAFEAAGYATRFALLNSADFGCPQRRVRCFMIGSRCPPLPEFPDATHAEHPQTGLFGGPLPWVTLRDFLASRPAPPLEEVVQPTDALAVRLAPLPEGMGLRSAGARETTRPGGHWGYRQGTFIANLSLPARTVTASASQDWVRTADGLRRLTWRECAGLQGFPEAWSFVGGTASRFRQIGNAVPILFGRVIGAELVRCAADKPGRGRCVSAPLPADFTAAIAYTRKEHARNGGSRANVLRLQQSGEADLDEIKGRGSADRQGASLVVPRYSS